MNPVATASQTVGPYFQLGCDRLCVSDLAGAAAGERLTIAGRVLDGDGKPVNDAMIELWQADPDGRHGQTGFSGFGRVATDESGGFRFVTMKPGRVPGPDGTMQAPHIVALVFMRGLLRHLITRIYFPGDPANDADAVLKLVPAERRGTLIARQGVGAMLEWNVVLQGRDETVFFDC